MMQERWNLFLQRQVVRLWIASIWRGKRKQDMTVSNVKIPVKGGKIKLRIYQPQGDDPKPLMLFMHGGGFVGFNIHTHDPLCRDICHHTGCIIISVDYRLAPEHPFPTGIEDSIAALDWVKKNAANLGANDNIYVCGDSAGGNFAAVLALQARKRHPNFLKGQILIYPCTDHVSTDWPSYFDHRGTDYGLTYEGVKDVWEMYTRNSQEWTEGQTAHDLATPYRVEDVSGLPPTLMILAEKDLLVDQCEAYAARIKEAGTAVATKTYEGVEHGFVGFIPNRHHRQAVADIAEWVKAQP